MAHWRETDWLLGRRFVCDFTVFGVGPETAGPERDVYLRVGKSDYVVGLAELQNLIECGLVRERAPVQELTLTQRLRATLGLRKDTT